MPNVHLYLRQYSDPIPIRDPGTRLHYHVELWWTTPCARTTVHGRDCYVELERPCCPDLVPIRRDEVAYRRALLGESLAAQSTEAAS